MTDEEVIGVHKDFTEAHKKAFRVAFDFLMKVWPPENSAEWFERVAVPAATVAYSENMDNRLARRLLLEVYAYLDEMAGKLGEKKEDLP